MNMPNRASRHHANRSSRLVRESRHQAASGLSLAGKLNSFAADFPAVVNKVRAAKRQKKRGKWIFLKRQDLDIEQVKARAMARVKFGQLEHLFYGTKRSW